MAQRAINLADGVSPGDAVTVAQLDAKVQGLAWKSQSVRVATTTNGALATAYANGQTVDGVVLATNDSILLKDQTAGAENGVYVVNASGAPTRRSDFNTTAKVKAATVLVDEGVANHDKTFTQTAENVTVGTTAMVFAPTGGGLTYVQGNGISITGAVIAAVADPTADNIVVGSGGIAVKPGAFPKKYSQDVGAMTAGSPVTITHNLGTKDVVVEVVEKATDTEVDLDVTHPTVNTITLTSGSAVSSGVLRVTVVG